MTIAKQSLLPCPFCGKKVISKTHQFVDDYQDDKPPSYIIECGSKSHVVYVIERTKSKAIATWNTRRVAKKSTR